MKIISLKTLYAGGLGAALLLAGAAPASADIVRTHTKGDVRGTVTSTSPVKVSVDTNPVVTDVAVNEIVLIQYDDEPNALTQARLRINQGQYKVGLDQLNSIDIGTIAKPSILQDIQFYSAFAQAKLAMGGASDARAAQTKLAEFITKNPGSYHILAANETLGDLHASQGDYAGADRYYKTALAAPWPETKMRVMNAQARALQLQKKWPESLDLYKRVAGANVAGKQAERHKLTAKLGEAASLAGTGKLDDGVKIVQDVILTAEKGDYPLHARAYNTLGDCYLAAQKPKDALLAYLHTDVLYFQDPELHAESLASLAQVWSQLQKPQEQREALGRLKNLYPQSRWAKQ